MIIKLVRYRIRENSCDGMLYLDGIHHCDTAEPTKLMLPEGIYEVTFRKHPVHEHRAPYIAASTFMIHGNGIYNAKNGDILLGEFTYPGVVVRSRDYFDPLVKRLEKVFSRGGKVTLIISKKEQYEKHFSFNPDCLHTR